MRCFKQTLIACLLIVAIPVQGFAATAMRMCSPNHHGTAVTTHQAHHHDANQQHEHPAQMQHEEVGNDQVAGTSMSDLGHGKCSACASCCVALAIVSRLPVAENTANATAVIPFISNAFSNHISDGLDPPPRPFLA